MTKNMIVTIIIPVYNEKHHIEELLEKIGRVELPFGIIKEIIIVDDGSTDGTKEILQRNRFNGRLDLYHMKMNFGKTAAVSFGIKNAKGDIILIQDADFEYNPENYPDLIDPIIKNKASVVYGSRFKGKIEKMALINRIANTFSNITVNLLYNARLSDINTGYKVFRKEIFDEIEITSEKFMFETEITAKLLKSGYKIFEIPINYKARSKKDGKKITWAKAMHMYWGIIKYRFGNGKSKASRKSANLIKA